MTADILSIPADRLSRYDFKSIRIRNGLSHMQIASCLGTTISKIQNWETGRTRITISETEIEEKISNYLFSGKQHQDRNLLFNRLNISAARHILDFSCEEMAHRYGYKVESWRKIEQHKIKISEKNMKIIENDVSKFISKLNCS